MARSVALVLFCGWISETCQECGRRHHLLWHSPQPLWDELIGRPGGILCPRCFDAKARATGIWTLWTPMVVRRQGVATTNWWHDPVRDRLLMGEPDPHYFDEEKSNDPQGHWGDIAFVLGWDLASYYPDSNRSKALPPKPGVVELAVTYLEARAAADECRCDQELGLCHHMIEANHASADWHSYVDALGGDSGEHDVALAVAALGRRSMASPPLQG